MKYLVKRTLAALILTSAAATAMATPAVSDSQSGFLIGDITPSPKHLDLADTYELDGNAQDGFNYSTQPNYIEGVGDSLEVLPEQTWTIE